MNGCLRVMAHILCPGQQVPAWPLWLFERELYSTCRLLEVQVRQLQCGDHQLGGWVGLRFTAWESWSSQINLVNRACATYPFTYYTALLLGSVTRIIIPEPPCPAGLWR